ncbi:hypothetical protein CU097_008360 [Rhizopus azygosporus]|uniref:C2H2-type domain-containing protein n=1 Tax=Rhizopus azygosporus TaxID=86630 RepID=A0A367JDA7_RHIAZ|nr:hypothetical protein CU097_008360 [Rhizopus azygosporus]
MKRHIFNIHGKDITVSRSKKDHGKSAHGIPTHVYNTNNVKKCKENITIIIKVSCPGCRDTFDTVSGLAHHVDDIHIKISPSLENLPKEKTMFLRWSGHFNELMAMPGILVFQQRRDDYNDLPTDLFPSTLLTTTRKETLVNASIDHLTVCGWKHHSSPQDSIGPTKNECAVIMAIVSLLSYLYDYDMKPLSEVHLISSYTHSFMHSLLSAKKPAKVAHCSNVVPEEFDDTIDRPDYKIDVYASSGHRFSYTNAYGEISIGCASS